MQKGEEKKQQMTKGPKAKSKLKGGMVNPIQGPV